MHIDAKAINVDSVILPYDLGLTLYTEADCYGCKTLITFLNENNIKYNVVDCTHYFPVNLNPLVKFIHDYVYNFEDYIVKYKKKIMFPIVFNNGKFIGYFDNFEDYKKYITNIYDIK
jgi:glutaredoxin